MPRLTYNIDHRRIPQIDVLVAPLIGQVLKNQLKHLIGCFHAAVRFVEIAWR